MKFLNKVIDKLLAENKDLSNLHIVLPGKRPVVFLKKILKEKKYSGFLPKFFTVEDLIQEIAEKGLAFVDANAILSTLYTSGLNYGNYNLTATYVTGGAFSLDGVHLTGTGYAIVANMFADAINQKYHSTLRHVYPGNYPGIAIP